MSANPPTGDSLYPQLVPRKSSVLYTITSLVFAIEGQCPSATGSFLLEQENGNFVISSVIMCTRVMDYDMHPG